MPKPVEVPVMKKTLGIVKVVKDVNDGGRMGEVWRERNEKAECTVKRS